MIDKVWKCSFGGRRGFKPCQEGEKCGINREYTRYDVARLHGWRGVRQHRGGHEVNFSV